ncbi:hypothetical protein [Actinoplanes sp. DH11]|uniref:hypothetical protein n=1 Tax=Actinoplanes sp. DH11 TaxID=2857011 RepID=UPI001E3A6ADD|nr:hypothetical protein [Actinoplanes sp. DH11]
MAAALVLAPGVLAGAVAPAQAAVRAPAVVRAAVFDQAAVDRLYVYYLAKYDHRSLVRTAAWNALAGKPDQVDALVARFLKSGLPYAISRSEQLAARNADFARRVLATHTAEFAPEVHAAAQFALASGAAALEVFARTGYAEAKERDRTARETAGEQAAALSDADREFVVLLRDTDPGPQVRAAAGLALRAEATEADVVEFFAYDWAAAAAVDLRTQQVQCADLDMAWREQVRTLRATAEAAHRAALAAAGEAREQARVTAANAWRLVIDRARPVMNTWDAAAENADRQAENWQRVAAAAAEAAENPNWDAIARTAGTNVQQWTVHGDAAAEQAAYWTEMYDTALAGELDMRP